MSVYTAQQSLVIGDPTGGMCYSNFTLFRPLRRNTHSADSVEEFKVNTAGQTADFNSSAGAEIKVVTKRGTSSFHGTAYEYYKDNNWSSNTWQNNQNNWEGVAMRAPNWATSDFLLSLQPLWRRDRGAAHSRKSSSAAKPFSFSIMKVSASPTPRPSPKRSLAGLAAGDFNRLRATGTICYITGTTIPIEYNGPVTYAANYAA